jgi:hypothetical protein
MFPECRDNAADPFLPGVAVVFIADNREVFVLKIRPFDAHAAVEKLRPSDGSLGRNKFVVLRWVVSHRKGEIVKASVEAVDKNIFQIGSSLKSIAFVTECFQAFCSPFGTSFMWAFEYMISVLLWVVALEAVMRSGWIVPVYHFARWKNVVN